MSARRWRIEVLHGVNLDQLGRRGPPYPDITLAQLEQEIARKAEQPARHRPATDGENAAKHFFS